MILSIRRSNQDNPPRDDQPLTRALRHTSIPGVVPSRLGSLLDVGMGCRAGACLIWGPGQGDATMKKCAQGDKNPRCCCWFDDLR